MSTNKIYAGIHWGSRKAFKDGIEHLVWSICRKPQGIVSYPVYIEYRFIFETRPLDTLNCAFMAKCIEDAFRTIGLLQDDDPKHVAKTSIEVVDTSHDKLRNTRVPYFRTGASIFEPTESGRKTGPQKRDFVEITINKL